MEKAELKYSKRSLLLRGFITFFFIGILYSLIRDKAVLSYFIQLKGLLQILFFTVFGGLLSAGVNYWLIKRHNKRRSLNNR